MAVAPMSIKEASMKVVELMSSPPVVIRETETLVEAATMMLENRISGLPVVNADNELVGIITDTDFSAKEVSLPLLRLREPKLFGEWLSEADAESIYQEAQSTPVRKIMTRFVTTLDPEDTIEKALKKMMFQKLHRLPVVEGKTVIGMLTCHDLLRLVQRKPE
jgi:CBS domain-containing protein